MSELGRTEVEVSQLPLCQFTHTDDEPVRAAYDGKTKEGPWAYMCEWHFSQRGVGLGLGKGQRLIVRLP